MNNCQFRKTAAILLTFIVVSLNSLVSAQTVTTVPLGFTTLEITAGTGTSKRVSLISIPLLQQDPAVPPRGVVASVEKSAVSVEPFGGGLPTSFLSQADRPFLFLVESGDAAGLMFLVSTASPNSESRIVLTDPHDPSLDLLAAGVRSGDRYRLLACDTLLSFFGTPETTGVVGGVSPNLADTVTLVQNGSSSTYYYSTTFGRWVRVALGSPVANDVPLLPYYGIQYSRIGASPLRLVSIGEVPTVPRKVKVKNGGTTLLGSFWPTPVSLSDSGVAGLSGWQSSGQTQPPDRIVLAAAGSTSTYSHDGVNWRRVGLGRPISDTISLPVGGASLITKSPQASPHSILDQNVPYVW